LVKKITVTVKNNIKFSEFRKVIKTVINSNPSKPVFKIPENLKIKLKESRKQVRKGLGISNEDLNNEILEWLEGGR
jgi:hypothetical protein